MIECISTLEGLDAEADPAPAPDLKKEADKVPAMCGAPEPPVEEVQTTAASITKLCVAADIKKPTEAEISSLVFIKQSLITFKQTFTSQISVFSQKLSSVTGEVATAASLEVQCSRCVSHSSCCR